MITVCLAGSHVTKEKMLLQSQQDIHLVLIEEEELDAVLARLSRVKPDIFILSDVNNDMAVESLSHYAYSQNSQLKTVIVTDKSTGFERLELTGFSCRGFVDYAQRHSIVRIVRMLHAGEVCLSQSVIATVLKQLADNASSESRKPRLVKS